MLATLKGKDLIDLHSPSCVVHLEYENSQYCNPLTLIYVILRVYQQTILSSRGRQAGLPWSPLTTSLLTFGFHLRDSWRAPECILAGLEKPRVKV